MAGKRSSRALWMLLALLGLLVVGLARALTPSSSGVGTHVALGLPPCGFLLWFELPCPACGLTTSFAHLAQGELAPALRAHPLGLPLFALALALIPASLRYALRDESPLVVIERLQADRWALGLVAGLLLTWLARLLALHG